MTTYLILGLTQHGKDTVAEIMREYAGLAYESSSEAALDLIFPVLQEVYGYRTKEEAFEDRNNGKQLVWKELITLYNTPDKTALARKVLQNSQIYVGMRCAEEYAATRHLFDYVIWVDASERKGIPVPNSMEIECDPEDMIVIDNNGTLQDLKRRIFRLTRMLETPFERRISRLTRALENAMLERSCRALVEMERRAEQEGQKELPIEQVIAEWADEVFPHRTVTNALSKLVLEEIPEYLMNQDDPMELADVGILVYDIAQLKGINLEQAIRDKMAINRKRTWRINPETGLMKHTGEDNE